MHINAGTAKGRRIKSVPGDTTRPVTDKVKQAVFNILQDDVRDTAWLDLFGGTGAIGIEALSRGAQSCVFLDTAMAAVKIMGENLRNTGFESKAKVIRQDAFAYLGGRPNTRYDIVYVAPPQYAGAWSRVLLVLDQNPGWVTDNGSIIVQIDPREYTPVELKHFELGDERRYGRTMLLFFDTRA
jgi:16S rRNA (guanine966-N2)-methyltransferase